MRRLAVLFCVLAGTATAQQGQVLGGDHPGFTRITMPMARDVPWTVGRTDIGYGIQIDRPFALDLTRAFDLIGRNRLSDITVSDGLLSLSVDCDCHATAFLYRDAFLVVDVLDGPAAPNSPFETALGADAAPRIARAVAGPTGVAPGRMVLPLAPGTAPIPVVTSAERATPPRPVDILQSQDTDPAASLIGLERDVVDSLARAASQGLLELSPDANIPDPVANAVPPMPSAEAAAAAQASPVNPEEGPLHQPAGPDSAPDQGAADHMAALIVPGTPGLIAQTSLDAVQAELGAINRATDGGGLCWPSRFTDLPDDGDGLADFGTRMGALRSAVTDDRDRADMEAVAALARGYLSFGFGVEAIQSLQIDGVTDRGRLALRAMAEVIDNLPQSGTDLAKQIGCPGSTALWAVLASARPEDVAKSDSDQVVQQFKLLPAAVQMTLGPRLADLLRLGGRSNMAELVLAPAERMVSPPLDVALAKTELALDRGDIAGATQTLSDLAAVDPRMTPDAMVQLVDLQLSQGDIVSPESVSLLEAMQFEFRGQAVAVDLMRVRVAALAQAGTFDAALRLLADTEPLLPDDRGMALRSKVTSEIAARADDMMFLDVAFRSLGSDVTPDVQNSVATRLLSLGFHDRATQIIAGPAIGSIMAERRYLRATAAMSSGDPDAAAAQLAGVNTPRAQAILGISQAVGPAAIADENAAAWRSGDWTSLASSDDSLLQDAAALVQADVSPVPDTETPLASGRALIEDAARTRVTIDTLMERFAPPS